jgi:iron complex transport system permease protein
MPFTSRTSGKVWGLVLATLIFLIAFASSIAFGQLPIPLTTTVQAFLHFDPDSTEHLIISTTRLSRAVVASVIGASLATAGALMQAWTRNPLASPSLFGINAGAMFTIVLAISFFSLRSLTHYMWVAFLGAAIAAVIVYLLGSLGRDGMTPIKIVLAGAAISALFISFTQGLLVLDEQNLESVLFWLAGSVSGRTLEMVIPILPFLAGAGIVALMLGHSLNILTSGDEVAKGLGQRLILVKVVIAIVVVVLAGGSVAIGGSIGFIGLIVPHMVRSLVGIDYRWIIPYCAVLGASLLLAADVAARFIIMPQEMPIGVMTACLGTPFFIYLARRGLAKQ